MFLIGNQVCTEFCIFLFVVVYHCHVIFFGLNKEKKAALSVYQFGLVFSSYIQFTPTNGTGEGQLKFGRIFFKIRDSRSFNGIYKQKLKFMPVYM